VDDASTTAAGKVELADNTEAAAASATDKALTPSNIGSIDTSDLNNDAGFISDITNESLNDLNDVSYTAGAGIDNYVLTYDHSTTSWGAEAAPTAAAASTTTAGIVELADNTEAAAASATDKALTPSNIGSIDTSDLNNDAGFISDITNESLNDLNDVSYTAGAGIDNYVLTYDHSTTSWGAEAAPTAAAASTTVAGVVELADNTEAAAASATDRALTPSNIPSIETGDLNNTAGFIADITGESLNDLSDVSYTAGAGIDNYVLTYDHGTTSWGAEAAPTAAAASTTVAGVVELADNTEAAAASATDRALTPANIPSIETGDLNNTAGFIADITGESLNDLSDVSYTAGAGIDNYVLTYDHGTTSWGAEAVPTAAAASTTVAGVVELADNTEAAAASATDRALTPSNIPSIETGDLNNTAGFIADITGESLNDLSDVSYTAGAGIDNYVLTYDHGTTSWGAEAAPTAAAASTTVAGVVELADNTEAAAASATDKALTPSNIGSIDTSDLNNDAGFIANITNESLNDLSDVSYTAGAGIDNYVLTYDNTAGTWGAEAASSGPRPTVTTDSSAANATITDPAGSVLEDIYLVNNSSTAVTITLPTVTSNSGYKVQIKRLGTADVTISPASGTIDGDPNQVLSVQYAALTLTTDGTNWFII
jgi:hypothetical protein